MIVAAPVPTAVTKPDELTVATLTALLDQETVAPAIALLSWSRTSALSCTVAPRAVSSAVAGLTVTVVGACVGVGVGVGVGTAVGVAVGRGEGVEV